MSSLQEETMDPPLGLSFPGVEGQGWPSASHLPPPPLAPRGFLAQAQLSGLTIAVPPSWSRQLGSSVWGLARPFLCHCLPSRGLPVMPLSAQRPHLTPCLSPGLQGMGWWRQKPGGRILGSPLPPHPRQYQREGTLPNSP